MIIVSNQPGAVTDSPPSTLDKLRAIYGPDDRRSPIRHVPDLGELAKKIDGLIAKGEPLKLALFWGPHPVRNVPGKADKKSLQAIQNMFNDIIPTELTVILADSHGVFNGIDDKTYLQGIEEHIAEINAGIDGSIGNKINAVWLSDLYKQHNISRSGDIAELVDDLTPEQIDLLEQAANNQEGRGHPLEYVAMRRREFPAVDSLLGEDGILLVISDPATEFVFKDLETPIAFIRGKGKSGGSQFRDTPPWIEHSQGGQGGQGTSSPTSIAREGLR